jgi:hypothetical protein
MDDAMRGVLEAMKGNDEFFSFHKEITGSIPAPTNSSIKPNKTTPKDEISIAGGGISINTWASRGNQLTASFSGSVMSPMTGGGDTIATGMSHAEVEQLVTRTVEQQVIGPMQQMHQQMQQQMLSLASCMDQSFNALQLQQNNHTMLAASTQDDVEQQSL